MISFRNANTSLIAEDIAINAHFLFQWSLLYCRFFLWLVLVLLCSNAFLVFAVQVMWTRNQEKWVLRNVSRFWFTSFQLKWKYLYQEAKPSTFKSYSSNPEQLICSRDLDRLTWDEIMRHKYIKIRVCMVLQPSSRLPVIYITRRKANHFCLMNENQREFSK